MSLEGREGAGGVARIYTALNGLGAVFLSGTMNAEFKDTVLEANQGLKGVVKNTDAPKAL